MRIDLLNLTDLCRELYFKILEFQERRKYKREYNTQYYKKKCDRLENESLKQTIENYTLQERLHKYEDLMTGLMGINEGLYRSRNGIAYIISYRLENKYGCSEKKLDFVLHQILPVFQANVTIAECRICHNIIHPTKTVLFLDYITTKNGCRNQGLGGEMIRYIEETAEKRGVDRIEGDIKQSEEHEYVLRIKFYSNLGYEITGKPGINKIRKELKGHKNRPAL